MPGEMARGSGASAWTVDDAMRMKGTLVSWLRTGHAARAFHGIWRDSTGIGWPDEPEERQLVLTAEALEADADQLACEDLVYADPPMTDMIAAAADRFPAMRLRREDFLSPFGLLILAKPLPTIVRTGSDASAEVAGSAFTWACREGCALAIEWERAHGLYTYEGLGDVFIQGLMPRTFQSVPWDLECGPGSTPLSVLRTMTALTRQPLAVSDRPRIGQAVRGLARRSGLDPAAIRRIRLRTPEHGPAELQAAREHHHASPQGHWVRGHWRNQSYPSIGEHRAVWIEGYPRGDFSLGTLTGPKALIAASDRAPTPRSAA